jgi:hypothetical protein
MSKGEFMAHTDKGKYFKKHDQNIEINEDLKNEIIEHAKNKSISCKKAEDIAAELGCSLEETGRTIDILNIKITKCQLGLFGYGETKKIVQPAKEVAPEVKEKITAALKDGNLPCAAAWEIASELNIPRMKICADCEALEIKVKPCQLGAF